MGFLFRIFLYTIIIYYALRLIRRFLSTGKKRPKPTIRENAQPENMPPPYDPRNVEDVVFKEVKKKKDGD
ncbi:MAG: hypothetical protein KDE52_09730 [Calditrichaeota bacterium]|nr:hypothetical protein [Calditrichota bacterium]MCB0268137.1 hypothetical protein [Calditrichota bacterium]MCB0300324.1 hypothetical protein [Calditrichota bacterium]